MTDPLDYEEADLVLVDTVGFSVTTKAEPVANQAGVSSPGMLDALRDLISFGVSNGHFRKGPPDPSLAITPAASVSVASNLLPDWRFVRSSNTNITLTQVRDVSSPSGSNVRFTFGAGAADDAAYIEQVIDIGGSRFRQTGDIVRAAGRLVSGADVAARVRMQYLTVDGSVAGMPAESVTGPFADGSSADMQYNWTSPTPPPGNAARLRLRVEAYRTSGSSAASLDVIDVRRDAGRPFVVVPDMGGATIAAVLYNDGGRVIADGDAGTSMVNAQLVPLTFVREDIPAASTVGMALSDTNMPTVMDMPFAGSIVAVSYRMDGLLSAGTLDVKATVGGSPVWTAHALTSGSPQNGSNSQAVGTDTFGAGDVLGVDLVTNGGFLPVTRDIVVTLWLAVQFTGA